MNKKELRQLSKNQLIELLLCEQEARLQLEKRVKELEHHLLAFDNAHTPSSKQRKKNTTRDKNKPRFPGKPPGSKGGGIKLPPPDKVVEHTLEIDPISGQKLGDPIGYRKKTIINLPDKPIQVIEHRIMQYISPATGEIIEKEVQLSDNIYGNNLRAFVVMLKNLTNSHGKIADLIRELGATSFSTERVQNISDEFTYILESKRDEFLEEIRRSNYAHSDETGMRKDGQSGQIWGVSTKTISLFFARMSRARKEIKEILGEFSGVLVTDGYRAYDYFGLRQRCWVHLLRELREVSEKDGEVKIQYQRAKLLYEQLKWLKTKPINEKAIAEAKWMLKDIVVCLEAIQKGRKLATLIKNGKEDWFTALYYQEVPLENNHAERELRPLVLLRKTIGCYRNEKGQRWIDIVISVLHTWKLRGINIFQQLQAVQLS